MNQQKQIEDIYPLSPMQQGLLYHALLDGEVYDYNENYTTSNTVANTKNTGVYVPQVVLSLTGLTDVAGFRAAWQRALDRHPSLRTAFQWQRREQPFQVVYRQVELPWQQQDWRSLSSHQHHLAAFLDQDRQQGFNLKTPPLMRLTLIQTGDADYYLVWTQHHLILDGWSAGLVLQQVFSDYQAAYQQQQQQQSAIPSSRPYRDYIAWLQQQDLSLAKTFWQSQLQGFTTPTVLPIRTQPPNPLPQHPHWSEQILALSPTATAALKSLAQQHHFTLNTLVQAAFGLLLSRYSQENDVLFGTTVAGRPAALAGSETMVGLFINTLPVRLQIPVQAELIPWLQQVQLQQAEALQYDYTPLLDIQTWSEIPRGTPLFDSLLVFENYPIDAALLQHSSGLRLTQVQTVEWTSLPLTLIVSASNQLTFKLKFDQQQFAPSAIDRLLHHLQTLLTSIATNPHQRLVDLPLLTPAEQQQLDSWNQTRSAYPQTCLHQLFEAQCHHSPDAIAARFDPFPVPHSSSQLTYSQLNARANQLAHHLHAIGISPETPIGLYLDRSLDLAIAILAVLKAGAAYVPLDPSYPAERLHFMLRDAQIQLVLSHSSLDSTENSKFDSSFNSCSIIKFIPLDPLWEQIAELPTTNLDLPIALDQSISIMYTSGSTGRPKGVINTHRGLVNRLIWMQQEYHLTPIDRVLQKTPFSFDVSVWEFFWPWLTGACLVIAPPDAHRDSAALVQLIQTQQITTLHFVPSMLQVVLEEPELADCSSLQRLFCSGEALSCELASRCRNLLSAALHNLYGPTEAAIDVSYFPVEPAEVSQTAESVPIGKPISNIQLYILDFYLNLVPVGVPGELYITGIGLARGYLHQPALTAETFIPNPFINSFQPDSSHFSRLYRTGDRACYLPDGTIRFLGRRDTQVKLRGYRIELGEIEAVLAQHPAIQQAIVTLTPHPHPHLVAHLLPSPTSPTSPSPPPDLISFLRTHLPDALIPTHFVWLDQIPLSPNGKLDRRALPTPDQPIRTVVPPRNPTEAVVAAIWGEVLQLETFSVEDSFFELGGNSLLATRINSRLRHAFQLELPLRSLLERPTVAGLAERIDVMQTTLKQTALPTHQPGRKEIEL